jgi:hypothetical protein
MIRRKQLELPLPLNMSFRGTYKRLSLLGGDEIPPSIMLTYLRAVLHKTESYERFAISEFKYGKCQREGLCVMMTRVRDYGSGGGLSTIEHNACKIITLTHLNQIIGRGKLWFAEYAWHNYDEAYDPKTWYAPRIRFIKMLINFYKKQVQNEQSKD